MRRNIYRHRWLFLVGGLPLHLPVAGLGPQDLWSVLGGSFSVPFSFARCVASFFGAIGSPPSYDGLRFLTGDGDCVLSQLTYSSQAHARRFTHTSTSKVQYSKPVRLQQHFGVFVSLPCCVLCRICSADYVGSSFASSEGEGGGGGIFSYQPTTHQPHHHHHQQLVFSYGSNFFLLVLSCVASNTNFTNFPVHDPVCDHRVKVYGLVGGAVPFFQDRSRISHFF